MDGTPGRPCRTLIVEDHVAISHALKRLMERAGHEVEVAETLGQGLAKLAWRPCCLLLDLMLPDGSGIDVLRRVRAERLPVRVAVTTAASDPVVLDAVRELAPDAFFPKPVDFAAVCDWLRSPGD